MAEALQPTREARMELLAPRFGLSQPWWVWPSGGVNLWMEHLSLSLSLCLLSGYTNKYFLKNKQSI